MLTMKTKLPREGDEDGIEIREGQWKVCPFVSSVVLLSCGRLRAHEGRVRREAGMCELFVSSTSRCLLLRKQANVRPFAPELLVCARQRPIFFVCCPCCAEVDLSPPCLERSYRTPFSAWHHIRGGLLTLEPDGIHTVFATQRACKKTFGTRS